MQLWKSERRVRKEGLRNLVREMGGEYAYSLVYRSAARPWGLFGDVGNHRVVVEAAISAPYVRVCVEWRRKNLYPERCGVLARALKDGREVQVKVLDITRQRGEYVLEVPEAGQYAIYYMPCKRVGDNWCHQETDRVCGLRAGRQAGICGVCQQCDQWIGSLYVGDMQQGTRTVDEK